jgi:hypothetical protein
MPGDDSADPKPGTRRRVGSSRKDPLRLIPPSAPLHTRTSCFLGDRTIRHTLEPADRPSDDPNLDPEPNRGYDMEWTFEAGALHMDAWEIGCYEGDDALCDDA